jgi:hypothetical protein
MREGREEIKQRIHVSRQSGNFSKHEIGNKRKTIK